MWNLPKAALRVTEVDNHSLPQSQEMLANKVKGCEEEKDSDGGRGWDMLGVFTIGRLSMY
jgi:hypothetical protein